MLLHEQEMNVTMLTWHLVNELRAKLCSHPRLEESQISSHLSWFSLVRPLWFCWLPTRRQDGVFWGVFLIEKNSSGWTVWSLHTGPGLGFRRDPLWCLTFEMRGRSWASVSRCKPRDLASYFLHRKCGKCGSLTLKTLVVFNAVVNFCDCGCCDCFDHKRQHFRGTCFAPSPTSFIPKDITPGVYYMGFPGLHIYPTSVKHPRNKCRMLHRDENKVVTT